MKQSELYLIRQDYLTKYVPYQFVHHSNFKYEILNNIMYSRRPGRGNNQTYNDCIIMFDTETSRKKLSKSKQLSKLPSGHKARENHVVAWTVSIRAFHLNIVTLWGHKPSTLVSTLKKIHDSMQGEITVMYAHNMPYDHWFTRRFLYKQLGTPNKQLNIKPHYPLYMQFDCGIQIRDSLILAQRSLERWAKDLDVEHKKAVGKWNYSKFRNQDEKYNKDELQYIEYDCLAGVECIDKTMQMINKHIYSMPYTSTGIIRDLLYQTAKAHHAKELFLKIAPDFNQYIKLTKLFHGGYVHANRFEIDTMIDADLLKDLDPDFVNLLIQCFDFNSSYPFCMLAYKYPMESFSKIRDCSIDEILKSADTSAFMFKLIGYKCKLKNPDHVMPGLQFSKCESGTVINPIMDNGRILECDYFEIYMNEIDLEVINDQYTFDGGAICVEVEAAAKDYLPRWFTDFVFQLYKDKCQLTVDAEKDESVEVLRTLKKYQVNGCYGMSVQKSVKDNIKEDFNTLDPTEVYTLDIPLNEDGTVNEKEYKKQMKKEYDKFINKKTSILNFAWGCWVTSHAFRNVHELNKCVKPESEGGLLLYNDTDSCYAHGWDLEKVAAYNENCLKLLRANNYDSIEIEGHVFTLGIAEHKPDKDDYTEFKVMGAKRYAGRCVKDGKIHITVAGVPKEKGAECLNDDLHNFKQNFIFKGTETGKKQHVYFTSDIYIDEDGNETADSIDLLPGDYKLDCTEKYEHAEELFDEEIEVQIYEENN